MRIYSDENHVILEGEVLPDDYIDYSNYLNPSFSGIYIKQLGKNSPIIKISNNDLPYKVSIANVELSTSVPLNFRITEEKIVFRNGKFLG